MSRVTGKYSDGKTLCQHGDFVRIWENKVRNLVEVNDWGDFVLAELDEYGAVTNCMDVISREPIDCEFVCRWDDERFLLGAGI